MLTKFENNQLTKQASAKIVGGTYSEDECAQLRIALKEAYANQDYELAYSLRMEMRIMRCY